MNFLPFRIGRASDCHLLLDSPSVSQSHAEVFRRRGELMLADLRSTNGTFINDRRVEADQVLQDGDVLRFADWEFRVVEVGSTPISTATTMKLRTISRGPGQETELERDFREMMENRSIWAVFQPIVRLEDRAILGYEALGRGLFGGVEKPPGELFAIAEALGKAAELSELLRQEQLRDAAALQGPPALGLELFLNTHPAELSSPEGLVDSLTRWQDHGSFSPRLCLEINETAKIDLETLSGLRENLTSIEVQVAFDDFGTGQPRLFELAEISPKYLKFDQAWIQGLDRASKKRLEMVRTLVRMVHDFHITPIAEGVERREEAAVCAELGFELAQGFFLGRPERVTI